MSTRVVYYCATIAAATPWAVAEHLNAAPITQHETQGGVIGVVTKSLYAAVKTWGLVGAAIGFASGVLVGRYAFLLVRKLAQS